MTMSLADFKDALGLNLPDKPDVTSYLSPAEQASYGAWLNGGMPAALAGAGGDTYTLGNLIGDRMRAISTGASGPANSLELLQQATGATLPAYLKQAGISQGAWDNYQGAIKPYVDANAQWANKYAPNGNGIMPALGWLAQQGVDTTKLKGMSDAQLNQALSGYNGYVASKQGGGFLDDVLPIVATAAGVLTGNPWIGALAGGLSSGISSGSPLAGLLGAAGGYFGANEVSAAGGATNWLSNLGDQITGFIQHPIDSASNWLTGLTTSSQSPAQIVDHSVGALQAGQNVANSVPGFSTGVTTPAGGAAIVGTGQSAPLLGVGGSYAGGASNLADYYNALQAISGSSPLGSSPLAVSGGATPLPGVTGLPSGTIPGTSTNVGTPSTIGNVASNPIADYAKKIVDTLSSLNNGTALPGGSSGLTGGSNPTGSFSVPTTTGTSGGSLGAASAGSASPAGQNFYAEASRLLGDQAGIGTNTQPGAYFNVLSSVQPRGWANA